MDQHIFQQIHGRIDPASPSTIRAAVTAAQHLLGLLQERQSIHLLEEADALVQRLLAVHQTRNSGASTSSPSGR